MLYIGKKINKNVCCCITKLDEPTGQCFGNIIELREIYKCLSGEMPKDVEETILEFSERVKVGRIIVNSPSSHGGIGDIYNTNLPSLTLGCGSFGKNSTTSNVSSVNLINIKRVAKRRVNMQWFKVPEKIYFEAGSIGYLEKMPNISRAFIVTDESMVKFGYVDKILYYLRKRKYKNYNRTNKRKYSLVVFQ